MSIQTKSTYTGNTTSGLSLFMLIGILLHIHDLFCNAVYVYIRYRKIYPDVIANCIDTVHLLHFVVADLCLHCCQCFNRIMQGINEMCTVSWKSTQPPIVFINAFPTSHNFCCLLSHLFMFLVSLYCKHYGPRSDCSPGSSLIRVHSVCFHDKK